MGPPERQLALLEVQVALPEHQLAAVEERVAPSQPKKRKTKRALTFASGIPLTSRPPPPSLSARWRPECDSTGVSAAPPSNWEQVLEVIQRMRARQVAPVDTMGCEQAGSDLPPKARGGSGVWGAGGGGGVSVITCGERLESCITVKGLVSFWKSLTVSFQLMNPALQYFETAIRPSNMHLNLNPKAEPEPEPEP